MTFLDALPWRRSARRSAPADAGPTRAEDFPATRHLTPRALSASPAEPALPADDDWGWPHGSSLPPALSPDSALQGPASDLEPDSLPAPAEQQSWRGESGQPQATIGRYAVQRLLGTGGLGRVHEAWDPLLSRTVAVKTLHFGLAGRPREAMDALILNEARAAARLSHRGIVTIHDAGLSAQGVYIAMERLQGSDLRQRLAEGWRPSPPQAALLVRRVAEALAYAHIHGVIHCDIKPGNIFLSRRDRPKLLDFGIAKVAQQRGAVADPASPEAAAEAADTAPQPMAAPMAATVQGSPHYLAPEQLRGGLIDARTDIHALGAVLYELLTYRRAFEGADLATISAAVVGERPQPAHLARPGVPRTLAAIAHKAMALDPAKRYASAQDMALDLRRWLVRHAAREARLQAPVAALAAPQKPRRQPSRRQWKQLVLLAVLCGVGIGITAWSGVKRVVQAPSANNSAPR